MALQWMDPWIGCYHNSPLPSPLSPPLPSPRLSSPCSAAHSLTHWMDRVAFFYCYLIAVPSYGLVPYFFSSLSMLMLDTSIPSFHPNSIEYFRYKLVHPLQLFTLTSSHHSLTYLPRIILPHTLALPSYFALRRSCLPIELLRVLSLPHPPPPPLPSLPAFTHFLLALLCALNTAACLLRCITSSSCCSDPSFVFIPILLFSSVVGKGRIRWRRRSGPFVTIITTDIAAAATAIASFIAISVFLPSIYNGRPILPFNNHVFCRPSSGFGRRVRCVAR